MRGRDQAVAPMGKATIALKAGGAPAAARKGGAEMILSVQVKSSVLYKEAEKAADINWRKPVKVIELPCHRLPVEIDQPFPVTCPKCPAALRLRLTHIEPRAKDDGGFEDVLAGFVYCPACDEKWLKRWRPSQPSGMILEVKPKRRKKKPA